MTDPHDSVYILVVDDEDELLELYRRTIGPAGYRMRTATNAHEAMRTIAEQPPAVAILDVHMPGPSGLWLADQIRAASPYTAIILSTGDATVPPTTSLQKGIVAYVIKPFERRALLKSVADGLAWWSAESGHQLPRLAPPDTPAPTTREYRSERPERPARAWRRRILIAAWFLAADLIAAAVWYFVLKD